MRARPRTLRHGLPSCPPTPIYDVVPSPVNYNPPAASPCVVVGHLVRLPRQVRLRDQVHQVLGVVVAGQVLLDVGAGRLRKLDGGVACKQRAGGSTRDGRGPASTATAILSYMLLALGLQDKGAGLGSCKGRMQCTANERRKLRPHNVMVVVVVVVVSGQAQRTTHLAGQSTRRGP